MMNDDSGSGAPRRHAWGGSLDDRCAMNRHSMSFAASLGCKLVVLAAFLLCPAAHAQTTDTVIGPRPLLYFDEEGGKLVVKAVSPDGRSAGTQTQGQLAGWSRQGDRFAFLAKDETSGSDLVRAMRLGGQPETVFTAGQGEHVFLAGWQSIWSPDSKRLALLVLKEPSARGGDLQFTLEIVGVERKTIEKRFTLPQSAYGRNGNEPNWPPYNLKWSPDGRKILLAWEQTTIFNVENGIVEKILPRPSMAEWLPGSDGVYFFEVFGPTTPPWERGPAEPELFILRTGQNEALKILDHAQLTDWGMANVVFLHGPLIKLSAKRSRLAIAAGNTVLAFEVPSTQVDKLTRPIKRWQAEGIVVGLEWGPSGNEVAILHGAAEGLALSVLDLASGTSTTLTKLAITPQGTDIDILALVNTLSWVP